MFAFLTAVKKQDQETKIVSLILPRTLRSRKAMLPSPGLENERFLLWGAVSKQNLFLSVSRHFSLVEQVAADWENNTIFLQRCRENENNLIPCTQARNKIFISESR